MTAGVDKHIHEYLNLADWTYADALPVITGGHAGYQWVLLDLDEEMTNANTYTSPTSFKTFNSLGFVTLPSAFQMIEVNIDKVRRPIYQCDHRWRLNSHIPDCAYRTEEGGLGQSEIERSRNTIVFNSAVSGVKDLPAVVEKWHANCPENMAFESMEDLCDLLAVVQAESFVYNTFVKMVVSNNPEVIESYLNSSVFKDLEYLNRKQEKKERLELWQSLGPEVGPEKCSQDGCERLRISLSINCFLHQLEDNEKREEIIGSRCREL